MVYWWEFPKRHNISSIQDMRFAVSMERIPTPTLLTRSRNANLFIYTLVPCSLYLYKIQGEYLRLLIEMIRISPAPLSIQKVIKAMGATWHEEHFACGGPCKKVNYIQKTFMEFELTHSNPSSPWSELPSTRGTVFPTARSALRTTLLRGAPDAPSQSPRR